jgi:antitoxin component YwqK of YwqJK toxin-antitoxin module
MLLLNECLLFVQPIKPTQVEYNGIKYWKYESVDSMNNTPLKFYYLYDSSGTYLGWQYEFPEDGKWINFYKEDSSKVASIFEIRDGLLNGKSIQYNLEGNKLSEYDFFEREENGFVRYWNKAGILTLEHEYKIKDFGHFKSSVRIGEWKDWDQNGNLIKVQHFTDNEPDGRQLVFYRNGKIKIEEFYKNGLRDSLKTLYHPNGQIKARLEYKNGSFVSNNPHQEFHPNGEISGMGDLEEGRKIGKWVYLHENGLKESEGEYGMYTYQHEHGDFYFSVKIGLWKYWYNTGRMKAEGEYEGQEIEDMDFGSDAQSAKGLRKDNWQYFNKKGKAIPSAEFEEQESISDY